MMMIRYHGGPITPNRVAVDFWQRRHACVSFARPEQAGLALDVAESVMGDNGAFARWSDGVDSDWPAYVDWVAEMSLHPAFDWAVIPDTIDGSEIENDALIDVYANQSICVPVWHLHESMERLATLMAAFPRVALGSSGDYATVGDAKWFARMDEAMQVLCDEEGRPLVKIHGLRMMNPDVFKFYPFASVDSTNVARNHSRTRRGLQVTPEAAALITASRAEYAPSPSRWSGGKR